MIDKTKNLRDIESLRILVAHAVSLVSNKVTTFN